MFSRRKYSLRSKQYIQKKRKEKLLFFGYYALLFVLVLTLLALISHLNAFRVDTVSVDNNGAVPDAPVIEITQKHLSDRQWWIFAKSNILLIPGKDIKRSLINAYPRIENIDLDLKGFNELEIEIEEYEADAVWCTSDSLKCYFMDKDGFIFAKAPSFSGNIFFRYYGGNIVGDPITKQYLPTNVFHSRVRFIETLREDGLDPVSFAWKKDNDSEIFFDPEDGSGIRGSLLFNSDDELVRVYEHVGLALSYDDLSFEDGEVIEVDYIDLRFGNKIFYTLK